MICNKVWRRQVLFFHWFITKNRYTKNSQVMWFIVFGHRGLSSTHYSLRYLFFFIDYAYCKTLPMFSIGLFVARICNKPWLLIFWSTLSVRLVLDWHTELEVNYSTCGESNVVKLFHCRVSQWPWWNLDRNPWANAIAAIWLQWDAINISLF